MIPGSREEGVRQVGIFLPTAMASAIRAAQDSVSESGKLAALVQFSVLMRGTKKDSKLFVSNIVSFRKSFKKNFDWRSAL
jgi:hypothetical protein